ncbi:mitochondrial import receptor subunit Tom22 [Malassezia furfur]|uniref:Mitochondrial import receptor subunit Tom22 n=1 Tax=Malassezia furfur TaxID=55194 RepID=A0ABY8EQ58_MALFU|nr:TOM22 [Malassezia furfur]WFD47669.1 mitochondrial import receptor subunit Tom22 [Malassezia furfur]
MVRIEEVQDEADKLRQQGFDIPADDEKDWEATSDESDDEDLSDDEDEVTERGLALRDESLLDRIAALKDIISPTTRAELAKTWKTVSTYSYFGGWVAGKLIWIGVTSALLVGLPFALAVEDESRISAQEKELIAQQGGHPGAGGGLPAEVAAQAAAAQSAQPQGLRPPGF